MEEYARSRSSVDPEDVVVEIVDALAAHGIPSEEYELYEAIDVEALARLVGSATGDVSVRFTVAGVDFRGTSTGVEAIDSDHS